MEYRAVGNRCAVSLDSLHLPTSREETLTMLTDKGFELVEVDIVALARQCITTSLYRRGARLFEAPAIVDCSSFIKWLYAQRGIWLPRRPIQQRKLGNVVELNEVIAGDLIFTSGLTNFYNIFPTDGVGHVSIVTGDKTVICATKSKLGFGVIEITQDTLLNQREYRGVRRYIPKGVEVLTFETPLNREVEVADDIRWIILQSLPKKK